MRARVTSNGLDHSIVNLGVIGMSRLRRTLAAAALSLATLVPAGYAGAADLPVKAKAKPIADVPFFFVIDDRVTYSYIFDAAQPGAYTVRPDGSVNGKTRSRSIRSPISTPGLTAPTSSRSRCTSRIITIRPRRARMPDKSRIL